MKRWTQTMLALCVAATMTACAGDRATTTDDRPVGTSGTAADEKKPEARADWNDRDFVGDMMAGNRAEVALGKLAQQKARNARVKEFAAMMARDHSKALTELKTVAKHANVDMAKVDTDADEGKDARERLAKLSGMEFDRAYMEEMVDKHERTLKDVENAAEDADNDHVKQWAAKALPTIKKHFEQAKNIKDSLDKRGT